MKQVVFKSPATISVLGQVQTFAPKAALEALLSVPANPQQGLSVEDVRNAVGISTILTEAEGDVVWLEDAQHKWLCERLQATKFAVAHQALLDMLDAVLLAATAKPPGMRG